MINAKKIGTLFFQGILILVAVGVIAITIRAGLNTAERNDCKKWAEQAEEYPEFYLTDWQKMQCEHHGIEVFITVEEVFETTQQQTGFASWYDYDLVGWDQKDQRCTEDREPCYSQRADTCASRDYPRGSLLMVTYTVYETNRMKVGHYVQCRVNDYGPEECPEDEPDCEWAGRIIDLSSYAFQKLAPLDVGEIFVTVEEIILTN